MPSFICLRTELDRFGKMLTTKLEVRKLSPSAHDSLTILISGKWSVRLPKGIASRYWEDILLAIIGSWLFSAITFMLSTINFVQASNSTLDMKFVEPLLAFVLMKILSAFGIRLLIIRRLSKKYGMSCKGAVLCMVLTLVATLLVTKFGSLFVFLLLFLSNISATKLV